MNESLKPGTINRLRQERMRRDKLEMHENGYLYAHAQQLYDWHPSPFYRGRRSKPTMKMLSIRLDYIEGSLDRLTLEEFLSLAKEVNRVAETIALTALDPQQCLSHGVNPADKCVTSSTSPSDIFIARLHLDGAVSPSRILSGPVAELADTVNTFLKENPRYYLGDIEIF